MQRKPLSIFKPCVWLCAAWVCVIFTGPAALAEMPVQLDEVGIDEAPPQAEGPADQEQPQPDAPAAEPDIKSLMAELVNLRKEVVTLRKEVQKLSQDNAQPEQRINRVIQRPRGADKEALGKIKLPENATKEQVREYVDKIIEATRNQQSYSSNDPQVKMYTDVGPDNLDVLLDQSDTGNANYHLQQAVQKLLKPEHKPIVIEAFKNNDNLISMIMQRGWEQDAAEVLLQKLRDNPRNLRNDIIQAIVMLEDPKSYDLLKEYLVYNSNREWTYRQIKDLPGIDLSDAVGRMWRLAKRNGSWDERQAATIAIEYGYFDALESLIDAASDPQQNQNVRPEERRAIRRYLDYTGEWDNLGKWFDENRASIRYDAKRHKFYLPLPM
ncbi:MAG: hypothetical protein GC164_00100 [Phycisphaera sp.]|nr:hypothetical protein [Phycisphaera sp.]